MDQNEFLIRMGVALLAGFCIGFERVWQLKTAGLRTHALVATGACAYVLISVSLTDHAGGDVTRIIGQVVVGIGFLGAGVIMRDGGNVQGLNSAATVWCSSAIGCLAGAGLLFETAVFTGVIICINLFFRPIEDRIRRSTERRYERKGKL